MEFYGSGELARWLMKMGKLKSQISEPFKPWNRNMPDKQEIFCAKQIHICYNIFRSSFRFGKIILRCTRTWFEWKWNVSQASTSIHTCTAEGKQVSVSIKIHVYQFGYSIRYDFCFVSVSSATVCANDFDPFIRFKNFSWQLQIENSPVRIALLIAVLFGVYLLTTPMTIWHILSFPAPSWSLAVLQMVMVYLVLFVSCRSQYQDCQYFSDKKKISEAQFQLFTTCQFKNGFIYSLAHVCTIVPNTNRFGVLFFLCYLCYCWFLCQFSYTQMPVMPINTDQNENRSAIDFYFV